jgi:hypothetical protein
MSPVTARKLRPLLLIVLAVGTPSVTLAACGGAGMSQSDIEKKIDAASVGEEKVADGASASELAQEQVNKDADAQAAADARARRKELADIEAAQKAEAQKVMSGDVPSDDPVSLDEQRFRARLAGVCEGAQSRITKVSKAAEAATKAKDPQDLLKVAQDYNDALNDFIRALKQVDAPASQQALYRSWLGTIDELASNIRLQLVSVADQTEYARLQKKTESLTLKFVTQTAQLGVTCLSVTG